MKISRKALQEGLEQIPMTAILGRQVADKLTAKQKKFAQAVAQGATKADAYRGAYNVTSKASVRNDPYRIANDPRIRREIEAYEAAIEAAKHRTPAALRELVIQSLVRVITDPDSKPGQITAAAKVLGTVTEVAAFTERKEVRTISSSEDARARVMAELRSIVTAGASDATVIEADSLLQELAGNITTPGETGNITGADEGGAVAILPGGEEMPEGQGATPPVPHPPE